MTDSDASATYESSWPNKVMNNVFIKQKTQAKEFCLVKVFHKANSLMPQKQSCESCGDYMVSVATNDSIIHEHQLHLKKSGFSHR